MPAFHEIYLPGSSIIFKVLTSKNFFIKSTYSLSGLWEKLGSSVEIMTPQHHDRVLAITSHLPHLIAYNIVNTAADLETVTKSDEAILVRLIPLKLF